ncbi:50S ribosomal protein L4 [Suttonella sp. R2A3]|uniref:50S ribosomal protein L4 n=1 Tax=Suttonella sp. R2A3 TaxID=2908648 RepID=UPI001F44894D|nr:50S ribosomal protein L4 [Suttonella sp. R2A3]UJF25447.1 50S ribosomal protein L4 [Suttonella sp. R2A3]
MDIQMSNASGSVTVADEVFGVAFNEALIHQVVTAYLAGGRSGTKAQKTRSEVSGGGAKPWRQKGTGRARAGTIRSPIWRSGGVTFAAKPRDYSQKVNKKMYRAAMRSIFSELARQERLLVLESFELDSHKTKEFAAYAEKNNLGQDVLVVTESANDNAYLATRNLPRISVVDVQAVNPALLLRHEKVAVDKAAIEKINEWLS